MDNSSLLQVHSMCIVITKFKNRSTTQQYGLILNMLYSMFQHTNQKLLGVRLVIITQSGFKAIYKKNKTKL